MRTYRICLALGFVAFMCPIGAAAVDGVNEISQTSILAAGGFPYTISAPGSYVLTSDLAAPLGTGALVLGVGTWNQPERIHGFQPRRRGCDRDRPLTSSVSRSAVGS
jgi:hypothetical protein